LDECFPNECDIAGPSNLAEMLQGTTEVVRLQYGSNMDLTQALTALLAAVAFLDSAIAIYEILRQSRSALPSAVELEEAVSRDAKNSAELDKEDRCRICEALLRLLREPSAREEPPNPYGLPDQASTGGKEQPRPTGGAQESFDP
jgi:hypothetical protein